MYSISKPIAQKKVQQNFLTIADAIKKCFNFLLFGYKVGKLKLIVSQGFINVFKKTAFFSSMHKFELLPFLSQCFYNNPLENLALYFLVWVNRNDSVHSHLFKSIQKVMEFRYNLISD